MFEKIGKDMKMPGVDVARIIDSNRKNLQALEETAKTAAKGAGDLMQRQRAMLAMALASEPQLHFEVRRNRVALDPVKYLPKAD